jgi:hypothetical protein
MSGRITLLFALLLSIALRPTPCLRLFVLFVRNVQAVESVGQRINKVRMTWITVTGKHTSRCRKSFWRRAVMSMCWSAGMPSRKQIRSTHRAATVPDVIRVEPVQEASAMEGVAADDYLHGV